MIYICKYRTSGLAGDSLSAQLGKEGSTRHVFHHACHIGFLALRAGRNSREEEVLPQLCKFVIEAEDANRAKGYCQEYLVNKEFDKTVPDCLEE